MEFETMLNTLSSWIWGWPLLLALMGTHLFLTFRLGFIQKHIGKAIRISLTKSNEGVGDVSHFGALMTALAATIGTGNIVGVATAVAAGGPGAVLWMWLTGVFGISTKYAEALASVHYRITTPSGAMAGGPMYVLEKGLGLRWLGIIFAFLTAVAAFGIGNMVQANSISQLLFDTLQIPTWISGVVITGITAFVILGGIKSIARVCEFLVPFMAIFYCIGCLIILGIHWDLLPATLHKIWIGAWHGEAAIGGFMGAGIKEAIRYGVARGLFSNESGLGSAPIVAAAAQTKEPVRQALVSSTGTFWDTVLVCAITGLVVVSSGDWESGLKGAQLTQAAFAHIPILGPIILSVGLLTFVFSTILGWSYYGEKAVEYLWGEKAILPYRYLWVIAVFVGSILSLNIVWTFADIANGLMAIPNLIALILLSGKLAHWTHDYFEKEKSSSK